jgi:hypothetical protein
MALCHRLDLLHERLRLRARRTDEGEWFAERGSPSARVIASADMPPSRASAPSRATKSFCSAPFSRIASATATACSLMASCACSRPTPARTAAISTLVVAKNGK